jgi:acyl-homoserine-lactone acylase
MARRSMVAVLLVTALTAACSNSSESTSTTGAPTTDTASASTEPVATEPAGTAPTTTEAADDGYRAEITRTEYGIPHIVADDWGSLGFGQGYAFAQDRACTLIDQVIKVRGERAKWFGPGEDDRNLDSDFAYRHLGLHDDALEKFGDQPEEIAALVQGYVDGFNEAVATEGVSGWCNGEPWVQPITLTDLYAYLTDVLLFASSGVLLQPIATAQPPDAAVGEAVPATDEAAAAMPDLDPDVASNGWAIGADLSESGGGMLLANPHFPWEGEKRLWESQLTLTTGELDVYGVTLSGAPGVLIGFNDNVAWTHTVSAGSRFTLYSLDLVPGDPTSYVYGDETRAMESTDVTIDVLADDGSTEQVTRTMWASHYGPMVNLPFGWTSEQAFTMRDANIDNNTILEQFFGMAAADDLDEFIDVHRRANGIPWVNTIATSADGRAWYADAAATPNLSPEAIAGWQAEVDAGGLAATVYDNGAFLLDGSDPINEWIDDPAAVRSGIIPFDQQPQLERTDYVFNANDSHWLANPDQLLTGFSPLTGKEAVPQSGRTRMNALQLADPATYGDDGVLSLEELEAAIFAGRAVHAELLLDQVVAACERTTTVTVADAPFDLTEACDVLAGWDGLLGLDSSGAVLWREFLAQFSGADRADAGALYSVPFDPADPVGTPNTLTEDDVAVLTPLGIVAAEMATYEIPLDITLGELQRDGRLVDDPLPIPGGTGPEGAVSIVDCCSNPLTLAPKGERGAFLSDVLTITENGYPITRGNSFMMALEFGPDGPTARAILTYGQPDDIESPDFTSQTAVYSGGSFRPVLFSAEDIATDPSAVTVTITGQRP